MAIQGLFASPPASMRMTSVEARSESRLATIAPALPPGSPAELISMYGTGCVECRQSGFVGRCAVFISSSWTMW